MDFQILGIVMNPFGNGHRQESDSKAACGVRE